MSEKVQDLSTPIPPKPVPRTYKGRGTACCATCGAPIPPRSGKGAQFRYCDAHAPARRAESRAWQVLNAEHLREYQRARDGSAPLLDRACPDCGAAFRGYRDRCPACRRKARRLGSRP